MLKDDWPDPSDITTCANLLKNTVSPLVMGLQIHPKYANLQSQINALKNNDFFLHFQQRYEGQRVNVIYSDYEAYRLPMSPQAEEEE